MKTSLLPLGALASLSGLAGAQIGPGIITPQTQDQVLSQTNFDRLKVYRQGAGSKRLRQVSAYQLAANTAGTWTVAMTVNGVDSRYGNTSLNDSGYVIMGELDEVKGTFVPQTFAAALNDVAGGNFGLMLHGRLGEHAVLDRADGVYYARRANHLVPFPAPSKVQGLTQTYVDPALGLIHGKLHLIYVDTFMQGAQTLSRILAQELDVSTPTQPKLVPNTSIKLADVTNTAGSTIIVHSPTPILDSTGHVHGLWLAERVSSDSDMYLKTDLDPAHPHQLTVDSTNWLNNGSIGSGRLYFAGSGNISYADVAWLVGDEIAIGSTGRLVAALFDRNSGTNFTSVLLATKPIPGVAVPGILGKFALDLQSLVFSGVLQHPDASQRAELALSIPNDTRLRGLSVWTQGLGIDPSASGLALTFTNTSTIRLK